MFRKLEKLSPAIILFVVILIINNCSTFRNFFPLEHIYYPGFGNGYDKSIIMKIKFTDGYIVSGEIGSYITSWPRDEGLIIDIITIFNINNDLIANYSNEYLNEVRKRSEVKNEFWVVYENGLVLIPDEYHHEGKWQKYIESIKKKEF